MNNNLEFVESGSIKDSDRRFNLILGFSICLMIVALTAVFLTKICIIEIVQLTLSLILLINIIRGRR
jgi:hypothetical protein